MAAGLSDSPSAASDRLISWTDRFCFRNAMTCPRNRVRFIRWPSLWGRYDEEFRSVDCGIDAQGPGRIQRIAESSGGLCRWKLLDEERSQCLVLTVNGAEWLKEALGKC